MDVFMARFGVFLCAVLILTRLVSMAQRQPEERSIFVMLSGVALLFGFVLRIFELSPPISAGQYLATYSLAFYFLMDSEVSRQLPTPVRSWMQRINYSVINVLRKLGAFGRRYKEGNLNGRQ